MQSSTVVQRPGTSAGNSDGEEKGVKRRRQRPGTACLECRAKKLKCDGLQPQCSGCVSTGMPCTAPAPQDKRGPKKGHLKTLQSKIDTLEQRLAEQSKSIMGAELEPMPVSLDEPFCSTTDPFGSQTMFVEPNYAPNMYMPTGLPPSAGSMPDSFNVLPDFTLPTPAKTLSETSSRSELPSASGPPDLASAHPSLLNMQLDQEMIDQFSSPGRSNAQLDFPGTGTEWLPELLRTDLNQTEPQKCLQHAVWTLAASFASQPNDVREGLYRCTLKLLESLESADETFFTIENVQARLFVCLFELIKKNYQRAWMSAGRCYRLVQLMRLHELDRSESTPRRSSSVESDECWLRLEEKRRTFWTCYSLDLFLSILGMGPPTLHEYSTCTRLPMPESAFQSGTAVEMPYLLDVQAVPESAQRSAFAEAIGLAALSRSLAVHRQRAEGSSGGPADLPAAPEHLQAYWDGHMRLEGALRLRLGELQRYYSAAQRHTDPLLLFTLMMAHTITLCLYATMAAMARQVGDAHAATFQESLAAFRQRAALAAGEIRDLSRALAHLSYLKTHPLTPVCLQICVIFLDSHRYLDESSGEQVQELRGMLKEMAALNNLALDCPPLP